MIKRKPSLENYLLCKQDFYGAAMKFKARSNTLPLNSRVYKWKPNVNINCPLCNNGIDDLRHFLFLCSSLNHIRTEEFRKLEDRLLRLKLKPFWQYLTEDFTSFPMFITFQILKYELINWKGIKFLFKMSPLSSW